MINDPVAVFLVLSVVVLMAVRLEERYVLFRSLGAALVGILLGMLLSNVGIIPGTSPTYEFLMGPGVNIGIALILLNVDVKSVLDAGPKMLGAFGIGAAGTAVGAASGALLLSGVVGNETWKLAGQFTGTYTGGGVNFAALGKAFDTSPTMFAAATAADVIVTAVWMAICLTVPMLFGRSNQATTAAANPADHSGDPDAHTLEHALHTSGRAVSLTDASVLVTIAFAAVWLSGQLASWIPIVPDVLWLTTIVLIVAQLPAVKRLAGAALWGNYLVLLFLASNGARSVVATMVSVGPAVFYFAMVVVAVHGLIIFGLGRLARIDAATLAVASQANVGGAASAMALASARGWGDRLLPGVAVGLLGYAIGNYLGFAVAAVVRGVVGG
jgi:uncharacterized membrane protein